MSQTIAPLPRLFAEESNVLKATASGFKTGHEPVHQSSSGTCVTIDAQKETWYCHSCNQGGDVIAAVMSLRGLSREAAHAYLSATLGEAGAEKPYKKFSGHRTCKARRRGDPVAYNRRRSLGNHSGERASGTRGYKNKRVSPLAGRAILRGLQECAWWTRRARCPRHP